MSSARTTLQQLRELPRTELAEEIETLVVTRFRSVLLMDGTEGLPLDISYFDLGLTSLRLTELRQSLETLLDLPINANVLFNEPTVERLVEYLTDALSALPATAPRAH